MAREPLSVGEELNLNRSLEPPTPAEIEAWKSSIVQHTLWLENERKEETSIHRRNVESVVKDVTTAFETEIKVLEARKKKALDFQTDWEANALSELETLSSFRVMMEAIKTEGVPPETLQNVKQNLASCNAQFKSLEAAQRDQFGLAKVGSCSSSTFSIDFTTSSEVSAQNPFEKIRENIRQHIHALTGLKRSSNMISTDLDLRTEGNRTRKANKSQEFASLDR